MAGAPLLPLASSLASAGLLTACGDGSDSPAFVSASFSNMAAPDLSAPANMATTYTASTLVATFDDKSTRSFELAYQPFFITGTEVSDGKAAPCWPAATTTSTTSRSSTARWPARSASSSRTARTAPRC
jgi:hypothetical protein